MMVYGEKLMPQDVMLTHLILALMESNALETAYAKLIC